MNSEDSACVRDAAISHINSVGNELYEAAEKFNSFAVAYKLVPFRDGNQWCVLLGGDIQSGIAGFGDSPAKAIADFDRSMRAPVKDCFTTAKPAQAVAVPDVPDDVAQAVLKELREALGTDGSVYRRVRAMLAASQPQATAVPDADVDLWSFLRDVLKRGAAIESQFSQQGYETFISEIEAAARKEDKRLRALLAASKAGDGKGGE